MYVTNLNNGEPPWYFLPEVIYDKMYELKAINAVGSVWQKFLDPDTNRVYDSEEYYNKYNKEYYNKYNKGLNDER